MAEPNGTRKSYIPGTSFLRCLTLSSLSAFLFYAGSAVHLFGTVAFLFSPTPLILLGVRENMKWMAAGLTLAGAVVFLLFGSGALPYFILGQGLFCFGLALPPGRVEKGSEALLFGTTISVISKVLFMGAVVYLTGSNPYVIRTDALQNVMMQMYSGVLGQGAQTAAAVKESVEQVAALAPYMLPSLILMSAMLDSFLNYRLCESLQRRRTVAFPPLPPFGTWRFPKSILWALLLAFVLPLVPELENEPVMIMLEFNLKFLVNIFFFIQGLSLVWWWLSKRRVHLLLRFLIATLLVLPVLGMWVIALGVGDVCLDFRKRTLKKV